MWSASGQGKDIQSKSMLDYFAISFENWIIVVVVTLLFLLIVWLLCLEEEEDHEESTKRIR